MSTSRNTPLKHPPHTALLHKFSVLKSRIPPKTKPVISKPSPSGFTSTNTSFIFTLVHSKMAALLPRLNSLKCAGGYYNRSALGPMEPDIAIMKSLAMKPLASELPASLNLNGLEVGYFVQGGFNKLYPISYSGYSKSYLLREALPSRTVLQG